MKTLTIQIPDTLDLNDREVKLLLASRLFENGKLTLGQAARFAGYSKRTFMDILNDYNVSVINHPISEIENDLTNARNYSL